MERLVFTGSQEGTARRAAVSLWGGELSLGPLSSFTVAEQLETPFNIFKTICTGDGAFRRSARAVRRHERHYHVLTFIERGRIAFSPSHQTVVLDSEHFTINKNSASYLAHFLPDDGDEPMEIYTLRVPDHVIAPYLPNGVTLGRPLPVRKCGGDGAKAIAMLMFEHGARLSAEALGKLAEAFLIQIASIINEESAYSRPRRPAEQRHFQSIEAYVKHNIADSDLCLVRVAKELNVTTRYVSYILHKQGIRFRDYIKNLRIELARNLLETVDAQVYSIAEIAALSGFASPSHFATTFKSLTGVNPRAYQMAARGAPTQ